MQQGAASRCPTAAPLLLLLATHPLTHPPVKQMADTTDACSGLARSSMSAAGRGDANERVVAEGWHADWARRGAAARRAGRPWRGQHRVLP